MDWNNREDVRKYHREYSARRRTNPETRARIAELARVRRSKLTPEQKRELWKKSALYIKNNPGKASAYYRKYRLKFEYGLTLENYDKMSLAQDGNCAICGGKNKLHGKLAVDHCHKTKKVRGLLCHNCNLGLGNFHESISKLESAICYLKTHCS